MARKPFKRCLTLITPCNIVATYFWDYILELENNFFFLSGQALIPPPLLSGGPLKRNNFFSASLSGCAGKEQYLWFDQVQGFWLGRTQSQFGYLLSEKTYFPSCVRNMIWVTIKYKFHAWYLISDALQNKKFYKINQ